MAVEYDVVIIGGSPTGRYAAVAATKMGGRVALVEPPRQGITKGSAWDLLTPHALSQIGQQNQQPSDASQFSIHSSHAGAMQWAYCVVSNLEDYNPPTVLASLGVDVIQGTGQFQRQPHLTFTVNGRQLRARAYLIATDSRAVIPEINGLQTTGYLTAVEIWQSLTQPLNLAIIGADPTGIQMAQTLTRLGLNVTLVVRGSHILAKEDPDVAQLVQAILEAEGVRVLTETPVTQVKQIQGKKWIQAGDKAIETDEILLCAGQVANIEALNLEALGVRWNRRRLLVNEKLQTTNPRIYACGSAIGGYQFVNIANYEARIALKNALIFPRFKVDYRSIPWAIFSTPQLARVGLTEVQARHRYPDVLVLRQYFKTVAAAQLSGETTGMCKLIVLPNGEILGAALVGSQAGELINVLALAISQGLKMDAIARALAPIYPSMSEILEQLAAEWTNFRLTNKSRLQNILESFFD